MPCRPRSFHEPRSPDRRPEWRARGRGGAVRASREARRPQRRRLRHHAAADVDADGRRHDRADRRDHRADGRAHAPVHVRHHRDVAMDERQRGDVQELLARDVLELDAVGPALDRHAAGFADDLHDAAIDVGVVRRRRARSRCVSRRCRSRACRPMAVSTLCSHVDATQLRRDRSRDVALGAVAGRGTVLQLAALRRGAENAGAGVADHVDVLEPVRASIAHDAGAAVAAHGAVAKRELAVRLDAVAAVAR